MNDFLYKEYELCFKQLQFYDERHLNLFKYLITIASSVPVAIFAIYKFFKEPNQEFFICQTFLLFVVFISSLILYLMMLQNRLYFVFTAKQINALRNYFLNNEATDFKDNQLYTSTDFPAIKPLSVHTFQLTSAVIISSFFISGSTFSFCLIFCMSSLWWLSIIIFVFVSIIELGCGVLYLSTAGKKSADEAIHRV